MEPLISEQETAVNNTGQRLAELRRSNAAGTHPDKRTKRNRDRSSQTRHAIRDSKEN